jgi:hypothetical protein
LHGRPGRPQLKAPEDGVWRCPTELCSSTFTRHYDLTRHLKSHEAGAARRHACPYEDCGKRYGRPDRLRAHIQEHDQVETRRQLEEQAAIAQANADAARQAAVAETVARVAAEEEARAAQANAEAARQAAAAETAARVAAEVEARAAHANVLELGARLDAAIALAARLEQRAKVADASEDGELTVAARRAAQLEQFATTPPEDGDVAALSEQDLVPRRLVCQTCNELEDAVTGTPPHTCYMSDCRRRYHSLCAGYHFELHPQAEFFCEKCLARTGISATGVEQAAAELVGLKGALADKRFVVRKVAADGECFFAAISAATKDAHGDARALMRQTGEALVQLRAFIDTPVTSNESADPTEWLRRLKDLKASDPKHFTRQLKDASERLAEGRSTYGEGWNSAAMDVAPLVMPALIGRAIHIWEFSVYLRKFPDTPLECKVLALPGMAARTPGREPVVLLRTKAAIQLAHYDLLIRR